MKGVEGIQGDYTMNILGTQLSVENYKALKLAMAAQLPSLNVQTINAGGKFAVNGNVTPDDVAAISALYDEHSAAIDSGFSMLVHQAAQRRRNQTHNATMKRQANSLRFGRW